jgi:hypothetical protein
MKGAGANNPSPQNINMSLRPSMYISRKTETRCSRNHCYHAKANSITYSECVFVALGIQHEMRLRHIVICGLCGSTIFLHVIS